MLASALVAASSPDQTSRLTISFSMLTAVYSPRWSTPLLVGVSQPRAAEPPAVLTVL
jgi:hypothetical protein